MFIVSRILLILTFPVLAAASGIHELPTDVLISRFSILDEGIYRGGQPDEKGFLFLKEQGVRTIINLRSEDDEGEIVEGLGLQYFHVPIRLIFPWSKIPDGALENILR